MSCFMNLNMDLDYAGPQLFLPNVIRAIGQAVVLAPLSAIALAGIAAQDAGGASGIFNMIRNLGGAIGTALLETFYTKSEQYHSFIIGQHVSLLQPATRVRLAGLQQYFIAHGMTDPAAAMHQAIITIGQAVRAQAAVLGYSDAFALLGTVLLLAAALIALLRKTNALGAAAH